MVKGGCAILWLAIRRLMLIFMRLDSRQHLARLRQALEFASGLNPLRYNKKSARNVNPNPEGHGLSLNITEYENALDFDLAREVADVFRVTRPQADEFITHVCETVAHWRDYAHQAKITRINESPFRTLFDEL